MKFHYTASKPTGEIIESDTEAASYEEVLQFLTGKGFRPISIKALRAAELGKKMFFGQAISVADKIFLTRYLSLMLRAGTDLFSAINVLISDFDRPALKALLIEVRTNLEKGNPFYVTFAKYPQYFSETYVNLVKSGEASGNLIEVLDGLSVSLAKEQALRSKISSAFVYPVILLVMSFLVVLLLATFAIPRVADVFLSTGATPPFFSRIVFNTGIFLSKNAAAVFPFVAVLAVGGWYFLAKTFIGRKLLYTLGSRLPFIRKVMEQYALQRFSVTFGLLLKAGIPIINVLEITADAVGFQVFKESLRRISREGVAKGLTLGEAFRREPAFPQVVTNLIAVSEKAGHTEEVLSTLASFYESEVDAVIKNFVAFIEPVLLLFIGLLIGSIALAVIVPIYQLASGI